ncbi:MAG: OmpH family outer membrane protein [Verrucomicrobiales bacterium]|nr:OmpH family outer membrane protein [Verrucomicrobiae bacterium]
MRKLTFLALLSAFTAFAPLTASAQNFKIGIVDMKEVFAEYYKTKDAEKSVNEGKAVAKQQLDERNAKYKSLISKWQEMQKMITDPAINEVLREQKQKEANGVAAEAKALEREMAEFRQRRERQLQEQVMRMRKGILDEIKGIVIDRARRDNYDLVFDKSGLGVNGVPFLLHSKDAVDFSKDVIATLNKGN